jgi:hypothetical protein
MWTTEGNITKTRVRIFDKLSDSYMQSLSYNIPVKSYITWGSIYHWERGGGGNLTTRRMPHYGRQACASVREALAIIKLGFKKKSTSIFSMVQSVRLSPWFPVL